MHLIGVDGGDRHLYGHAFVLVLLAEGDDIVFNLCIQRSLVVPDLFRNRGAHIGRCGVEERVHELVIGQEGLSVELCRHPLADDGLFHFCLRGNAHFAHGESGGVLAAVFLFAQGGPYHFAFAQGGNFPPFTVLLGAFAGILPAGAEQVPCYEVLGVLIILFLPDALLVLEIKYEGAVILELPAVLLAVVVFRLVADHTAFPQAIDVFAVVHVQLLVADHVLVGLHQTAVLPDGNGALGNHRRACNDIDVEFN